MSEYYNCMKFLFIINPTAGKKSSDLDAGKIAGSFASTDHVFDLQFTTPERLADAIVRETKDEYDVFVAVGGDGTINEIGKELVNTTKIMGIVPNGSGNGLARSLGISLEVNDALEVLSRLKVEQIDAINVNGKHYFFNMAGIGFDAYIARKFDKLKNRGLTGYINVIIKKFFFYKGNKFKLMENGDMRKVRAFMISFANTTQFGNNAHIAPMAKYDDGKFDLCILKNFPKWKTPELAIRLFNKSIHESKYFEHKFLEKLTIARKGKIIAHLDGEPMVFKKEITLEVVPKALHVITGN